jgi:O-antigen/teichoic acid export membrane protein
MEYKRIFKDGIHLFAGKLGTVVISLVDMMILARILTTEEMGAYSLALMIVNLALIVGLNWSDTSVVRHGREEYVKRKKINQSFWARIYLFVPVIIIFALAFLIFGKQITDYVGIDHKFIIILIAMFVLNGLLNFINYIYQSTDQMKKSAYVLLSQKIFYLICLATVFFGLIQGNIIVIFLLINISFLLAVIMNIITFDFKKILPYKFSKTYFKRIWSYSWPQLLGFPGIYVINYIDLFVIKKYMALHYVGVYTLAYNVFINITAFIMIMHTIFLPLIVEYRTTRKFDLIGNHIKKTPIFLGCWIILVAIGLLLSNKIIPLIFSNKYIESVPSFEILLIASVFYFISIYLLPIVNAFDLIFYSQIFNLIKAGVNVAADFILVPKMGIIGAAYGTLLSYFTGLCLTIILLIMKRKMIFGQAQK